MQRNTVIKKEKQNDTSYVKSTFTVSAKLADAWPKCRHIVVLILFHLGRSWH